MYEGHRRGLSLGKRGLRKEKRGRLMMMRKSKEKKMEASRARPGAETLLGATTERKRYHTKPHTRKWVV